MPRHAPVADGETFVVRTNGGNSEVVSSSGTLSFVLKRAWEQRYERKWLFTLWSGDELFGAQGANLQPLMTLIRLQQEVLIRLQAPDQVLTDVVRIDDKHGYIGSDPRHRFAWEGNTYLLSARTHSHLWGGRDIDCINEQTGELVMQFSEKNFSRKISGHLTISQKFGGTSLVIMVGAFFAFREFDTRLKLLKFGDPVFTANVTG
ncbi:hypothetical protein WJX73_002370 [Symbiochloris irregularis]|uniref:Uncharacterized protein n=1 Tax=Symbiochloris irregularis TaxID=706552 RepID=A0AAW1NV84_9CHLO